MEYKYTLSSAMSHAGQGRLEEWVHGYLCSEGTNKPFSDGLKLFDRYYIGPISMPLSLFERICGPEEDMRYRVNAEGFEKKVSALVKAILDGADLPPLIVHYYLENGKGHFELNDGNHRHEALARLGAHSCHVIVWITDADELGLFTKSFSHCIEKDALPPHRERC